MPFFAFCQTTRYIVHSFIACVIHISVVSYGGAANPGDLFETGNSLNLLTNFEVARISKTQWS